MDWETPGLADRIREALSAFLPHGGRDADIWVRLPDGQDELRHYRIPKVSPKDRDAIAKMAAIPGKTVRRGRKHLRLSCGRRSAGQRRAPPPRHRHDRQQRRGQHRQAYARRGRRFSRGHHLREHLRAKPVRFGLAVLAVGTFRLRRHRRGLHSHRDLFRYQHRAQPDHQNRPEKPRHGIAGILRRPTQENASASSCAAHAAAPADGGVGRGACRVSLRTAAGRFIVHVALGPVPVDPAAGIPAAGAVSSTAVPNGYGHGFGTCRAFRARSVPILPRRKNSGR